MLCMLMQWVRWKVGGCREFVVFRREIGTTSCRSYHENFYEAALYQLVGNIRTKLLERELGGKVGKAGMERRKRKNRKSSKSKIVCIYKMVIIALSLINSLARAGRRDGGARRWDLASESSCVRVGEWMSSAISVVVSVYPRRHSRWFEGSHRELAYI